MLKHRRSRAWSWTLPLLLSRPALRLLGPPAADVLLSWQTGAACFAGPVRPTQQQGRRAQLSRGQVGFTRRFVVTGSQTNTQVVEPADQNDWWENYWNTTAEGHGQGLARNASGELKLRKHLLEDYPQLRDVGRALEIGVGAGRAGLQLLLDNQQCSLLAVDCSPLAVSVAVRLAGEAGVAERFEGLAADAGSEDFAAQVPESSFDAAMLLFTLEAVPPPSDLQLLRNLRHALRPGGIVTFRDYAVGDAIHGNCLQRATPADDEAHDAPVAFWRRDGRFIRFFDCSSIRKLAEAAGLIVDECAVQERSGVQKRKGGIPFHRAFVNAVLRKPG
eukprot:TRINITY_DN29404_c0_g1_i1.p1 TRINITY_DN29404_c0_g1~~TRINITY_DN29404_c0_g1_i1.p1  ORF type:complete len:332 (-),score=70.90 TRINITY_DN29404_c0_g1_i1:453-1448(-)